MTYYKLIPAILLDVETIFSHLDLSPEQLWFSAFHFNQSSKNVGEVESFDRDDGSHFLSGRHLIKDGICVKGAGISSLYSSPKQRVVLGGMSLNAALKEYLSSAILRNYRCIEVTSFGRLVENPIHFYCVRRHVYKRLSFSLRYEPENLLISNFESLWKSIIRLTSEGIIHSSLNSENINSGGEIIDCEGFYRTKSDEKVVLPFTFETTSLRIADGERIQSIFKKAILRINYLEEIYELMIKVGVCEKKLKEIGGEILSLALCPSLLSCDNSKVVTIKNKEVAGVNLCYVEVELSGFDIINSIKNKNYLRLLDSHLFKNLQATSEEFKKIKRLCKLVTM